jgi:pimeloyl-ACP methyl ester carboxylesterase
MLGRWPAAAWLLLAVLMPWRFFLRQLMHMGADQAKAHTQAYLQEVFNRWSKGDFIRHSWYGRGGLRSKPGYRVRQPLLIIHGEHEMGFVYRDAAAWAEREAGCRYVVVPDAGHVVNMDNPAAFNAALLAFLAEAEDWPGGKLV